MCALWRRLTSSHAAQHSYKQTTSRSSRLIDSFCCSGGCTGRYMKVVQAHEYSYYWGQHDQRPAANSSSSSSTAIPSAAVTFFDAVVGQQLLLELNASEGPWDLIHLAEQQQCNMKAVHWLKLLFRLFVLLHESEDLQYDHSIQRGCLHDKIPDLLLHSARALDSEISQQQQCNTSSSSSSDDQQAEQQQQLLRHVADATFAVAVYALDCEEVDDTAVSLSSSSSSSSSKWYLSSGARDYVNALATLSSRSGSSFGISHLARVDAVSLLWASGQLIGLQQQQQQQQQQQRQQQHDLVLQLCSHVTNLIQIANNTFLTQQNNSSHNIPNQNTNSLLDPWHSEDLTDAVVGLAAAQCKAAAAAAMLDAVAHEVYRQVSNRHSAAGSFTVENILKLLEAYADLDYKDGPSLRMFDAVAGWIVKRIRAKHVQAVSSTKHIAAVAQVYARLQHKSVVVPELLNALGQQARLAAAAAVELAAAAPAEYYDSLASSYCHWKLHYAAQLLESYLKLGYRPPEGVLMAMMPALLLHLHKRQQQQSALDVLEVLAVTKHHPGSQVLDALLLLVWSDEPQCTMTTHQLVTLLFVTAQLAAAPPAAALAAVADELTLVAMDSDQYSSSSGEVNANAQAQCKQQQQRQQRLSAPQIIRVLWSLIVVNALNIQRLGWLFVAAAAAKWQHLTTEQLLVIKQAQVVQGCDGADMAVEVLPHQLITRAEAAWQQHWCEERMVLLQEHKHDSSSSSSGSAQPPGCDSILWQGHQRVDAWLRRSSSSNVQPQWQTITLSPEVVCNGNNNATATGCQQQQSDIAEQDMLLLGAWFQQDSSRNASQTSRTSACNVLRQLQPLQLHPIQQQQLQQTVCPATSPLHSSAATTAAATVATATAATATVLLLCPDTWYSSNEPHVPLGDAVLHWRVINALIQQQQQQQEQHRGCNKDSPASDLLSGKSQLDVRVVALSSAKYLLV